MHNSPLWCRLGTSSTKRRDGRFMVPKKRVLSVGGSAACSCSGLEKDCIVFRWR